MDRIEELEAMIKEAEEKERAEKLQLAKAKQEKQLQQQQAEQQLQQQMQQQMQQQPKPQQQQPKQQVQQVQQVQKVQQGPPQKGLAQLEVQYTQPNHFKSFCLIKNEIEAIKTKYLVSPVVQGNEPFKQLYNRLIQLIGEKQKQLLEFVEQRKVTDKNYGEFVQQCLKDQQNLLQQAQQNQDKLFIGRIQNRINILNMELQSLKQNPYQTFVQIVQQINPNIQIAPQQQQVNRQDKKQQIKQEINQQKLKDDYKLGDFKSSLTAEQILAQEIDQKPKHVKFEFFLRRYKQYVNMLKYFSKYQPEKKKEYLDYLFKVMEKAKVLREDFQKGLDPAIAFFTLNEMKEITFDVFHQKSQQFYKKDIADQIALMFEANKREKDFLRIALHSKPILQKGQKMIQPHEESKQRSAQYEDQILYLKQLEKEIWIPFPDIQNETIQVQLCLENKDIPPNVLRLKFIKLQQCKYEKYYLTYALEVGKKIISNKTDVCDQSCIFNSQIDVPITGGQDIANKQVEVRLYEKGFFSDSEVGLASFSFDSLQERSVCDGVVVIKSKKGDIQLCYQLGIREPLNKFSTHQIQFLRIVNKYPPFNVQEEVKEYLEKNMVALPSYEEYKKQQQILEQQQQLEKQKEEEALKLQQQEEENLKKQQEEMQKQAGQLIVLNHMPDSPEIAIIKQYIDTKPQIVPGLELQDLIYPENPVKFPVYNFMDQYTEFLRLKGVELRQEPSLRPQYKFVNQMWESYLRQKTVFGAKIDNEEYEWYLKQIKPLLPLHENLKIIYNGLGLTEWEKFIDFRYNILKQEVSELSQM